MQGVWTIYIDPKADAIPMAQLPGLGKPQLFDLRDGNDGMLDPFSLAERPSEAPLLALETVRLLLGGEMDATREEALIIAIEQVVLTSEPVTARRRRDTADSRLRRRTSPWQGPALDA